MVLLAGLLLVALAAEAHRSGCHRWHSCPSDTGSYECGDLGYCSACPDNQYCAAGAAMSSPVVHGGNKTEWTFRAGVPPRDAWTCPADHPIKGNFTTYSGERCIYHPPSGAFYGKTKSERCYASGQEAVRDGCRASKR